MNTFCVYVGVDVAKDFLDVDLPSGHRRVVNAPADFGPLLEALRALGAPPCVCLEASGGYEKPLCDALEKAGIAFMAEFPRRLNPATLRLKELIATRLGRPELVFCHSRVAVDAKKDRRNVHPYSITIRHLMELVDWVRYVVGRDPTSVVGVRHDTQSGNENHGAQFVHGHIHTTPKHAARFTRSVFARMFDAFDDEHVHGAARRLELQTKLLLERGRQRRAVRIDWRKGWRARRRIPPHQCRHEC